MHHLIPKAALAVIATVFACGCGSNASNQQITEPASSGQDTATPNADSAAGTVSTTAQSSSPDTEAASPGDSIPSSNASTVATDCGGRQCESGQACIEYYGFAGKPLYTCGIPCAKGAPNDGCPEAMRCVVIPDGPTQCMPR